MKVVLLLATTLLLVGCGTQPAPSGELDPLAGRTFLSTGVTEDGAPLELVPDTRIRLNFADGELTAAAGCNTLGGSYRVRDGVLEVGMLRSTHMGCPAPLAEQDRWLTELLEARPTVVVEGDELILTAATTRLTFLDRRVADPDRPLIGTEWVVESLISDQAVSSIPSGTRATMTFHDDGSVSVLPGCNTGRGRFVTGPGTVTVSDVVLTRMACLDEHGELEAAVLAVLETAELGVRIEAASLTLMAGDQGLRLRAL